MELAFFSRELRDVCTDLNLAKAQYGEDAANQLINRLADLRAAPNLSLHPEHFYKSEPKFSSIFHIAMSRAYKIEVKMNHQELAFLQNEEIDLCQVYRLLILSIREAT